MTDVGIGLQLGALTYTLSAFDGETAAPLATLPAESIGPPGIRRLFEYGCQTDSDGVWQKLDTFFQWPRLDITGSFPKALQVRVDGAFHTPEALCVDLLRRLKAEAERHIAPGDRVNRCAIGIPDDATPAYQDFIRKNAQAAGFHWVELVPELESSALALLQAGVITGKYVALCDIGETSTQIAVVRVLDRPNLTFEILASGNLSELGAWQLDTFLIEHIMADLDREQQIALAAQGVTLRRKVAEARKQASPDKSIISIDLGQGNRYALVTHLLEDKLAAYTEALCALLDEVLQKAGVTRNALDQVLISGEIAANIKDLVASCLGKAVDLYPPNFASPGCAIWLHRYEQKWFYDSRLYLEQLFEVFFDFSRSYTYSERIQDLSPVGIDDSLDLSDFSMLNKPQANVIASPLFPRSSPSRMDKTQGQSPVSIDNSPDLSDFVFSTLNKPQANVIASPLFPRSSPSRMDKTQGQSPVSIDNPPDLLDLYPNAADKLFSLNKPPQKTVVDVHLSDKTGLTKFFQNSASGMLYKTAQGVDYSSREFNLRIAIIEYKTKKGKTKYRISASTTQDRTAAEFRLNLPKHKLRTLRKDTGEKFYEILGAILFRALMVEDIRALYQTCVTLAKQGGYVHIHLEIRPTDIAALPWEYLFDPLARQFLIMMEYVVLSRCSREQDSDKLFSTKPLHAYLFCTNSPPIAQTNTSLNAWVDSFDPGTASLAILEPQDDVQPKDLIILADRLVQKGVSYVVVMPHRMLEDLRPKFLNSLREDLSYSNRSPHFAISNTRRRVYKDPFAACLPNWGSPMFFTRVEELYEKTQISSELAQEIHEVLLATGYDRYDILHPLFCIEGLAEWKSYLPQKDTPQTQVNAMIKAFFDKRSNKGNALVLLFEVIVGRLDKVDQDISRAQSVLKKLKLELEVPQRNDVSVVLINLN